MPLKVSLLDYGAGNVRSLVNALVKLGFEVEDVTTPEQIAEAQVLVFPGVGSFGKCMEVLREKNYEAALRQYVQSDRPFLGICLGMQSLFEKSDESPGVSGLGVIPCPVIRFQTTELAVPQIGWNGVVPRKASAMFSSYQADDSVYFVHSYRVPDVPQVAEWALCHTDYGAERYISGVQRGRVAAVQFHPEKSGEVGLAMLRNFLTDALRPGLVRPVHPQVPGGSTRFCKRVIACLDVRTNDNGDLVVTKGDQYDVRGGGDVRNLGKPVSLAQRYYDEGAEQLVGSGPSATACLTTTPHAPAWWFPELRSLVRSPEHRLGSVAPRRGPSSSPRAAPRLRTFHLQSLQADEVTFLNITGFRDCPLTDLPMLQVLVQASRNVFVPLTVGGGIRQFTDGQGVVHSALDVASAYFRAGADKISIGSDAVEAARALINGKSPDGSTAIEQISHVYGRQAVVTSIDPRRVRRTQAPTPRGQQGGALEGLPPARSTR